MKPRILIILNRLVIGGQTFATLPLAFYLKEEFDILVLHGEKEKDEEAADFFAANYPGVNIKKINLLNRNIKPLKDIQAFFSILSRIKEFKPDIVHTHGAKSGLLGRIAAKVCRVKIILHTFHGHVFHSYFNKFLSAIVVKSERLLAGITTKIIALSNSQKEELLYWLKVNEKKIEVVPLGIDYISTESNILFRNTFRAKYSVPENTVAVGIFGRLTYIKNVPFFVEVINEINKLYPEIPFIYFIIGDGTEKEKIIQMLNKSSIPFSGGPGRSSKKVILTSWIKNIQEALEGLDIVVLTSFNEGTPLSLIEAQLCGKPVVAVNVGGVSATFTDGDTGFLIPTHDEKLFAEKIKILAEDKILYRQMSKKAMISAKEKFSKQNEVNRMSQIYKSLIKKRMDI